MSNDNTISFLTYYIRSLAERTRVEKSSTKYGFDWVIYNLALADDLTPYRLPFIRSGADEISKTKTEPEFGIDFSFLSSDRRTLTIFVLKDEVLCNSTWTTNDFDADLRKASAPDLTAVDFRNVQSVRIILAYNKDEDQAGIQLFTNLIRTLGTRIGDQVTVSYERWNLTAITERVRDKLLTSSLLPQRFYSLFSYLCSQFSDFHHGSDEWTNQLIPNWRRFLDDLLKENADERSVRLVPVALIVLREHGRLNPSSETGWIDLVEWAMLAVWRIVKSTKNDAVKSAGIEMWISFYLAELERFYNAHASELAMEHSLEVRGSGTYISAIAASVLAYWHIGRLGILAVAYDELLPCETEQQKQDARKVLHTISNQLVGLLNANPAAKRPLLDIHHIELFLVWRTLWQIGRIDDVYHWLLDLERRLLVRRVGTASIPFIEGSNSIELVFEYAATGMKPPEFCDQSSLLLLSIMEFCCSLDPKRRDELIAAYYRQIVLGQDSCGEQMQGCTPIDLMGWSPPEDWAERLLSKSLTDEGESQTLILETFEAPASKDTASIPKRIEDYVHQNRTTRKFEFPNSPPLSVLILACLKHRSPLPPEFWRSMIYQS